MPEVMIITAVPADRAVELRAHLRNLDKETFSHQRALPPTHFGRFVVIELGSDSHLLFSSRFDGRADEYLSALARFAPAQTIWDFCGVLDDPAVPGTTPQEKLDGYLADRSHHLTAQYVIRAFPRRATVAQINAALRVRSELSRFATQTSFDQIALAHNFRQLPGIRQLLTSP